MNHENNWSKLLIVVLGMFFVILVLSSVRVDAEQTHEIGGEVYKVQYSVEFSEADLGFGKLGRYDLIYMRNASVFSDLGKPVLPEVDLRIAIPPGTEVTGVEARSLNSGEIEGDYYLMPGQPPLKTSEGDSQLSVEPDGAVYESRLPYPDKLAKFVLQSDLAGQEIAELAVYPVQYVPGDRKLILHKRLELIVICRLGKAQRREFEEQYHRFTESQHKIYEKMLKTMVVNPEAIILNPPLGKISLALPSGTYDHVIITSSSYSPNFQPLVDWHTKKGLKDTVVTTDWIYTNYPGPGDTLKIRQFIIDANASWGTTYFLIGGEKSIVPFKYINYDPGFVDENTPSDQYYSDYDDDWTNEVFVGRASVQSSTEVTTFVNKVLKYEKDPPLTDYPLNVLLIGMDVDASTHLENLKNTIDGYIPPQFSVNKVYDSHGGNHEDSAKSYLNAGQNLVNHADHANYWILCIGDYWHDWGIDRGEVNALSNDNKMSIVVSLGCWPNAMDYSDCIAEHFVIRNPYQAGVAFTGNTRSGVYYVGQPASLSGQLDRDWWRGIFQYDQKNLGEAIVWSKHHFSTSSSTKKHCEWTFNLLGDPAMPIWTDTLKGFDVTHPPQLPIGLSSFTVHVEGIGGGAVESAQVCLWKRVEVYERGYTDSNGDVVFNPTPLTTGTMYVTVTKYNYLPYEDSAQVFNNPPDMPGNPSPNDGATDVSIDAVLDWSGGDPDSGDTVTYDVYFEADDLTPDELVSENQFDTSYVPGTLDNITTYYWQIISHDNYGHSTEGPIWNFTTEDFACGDCNGDGRITGADATYIANFLYRGGPTPLGSGDVNLDERITGADATYITTFVYRGGPPPCEPPEFLNDERIGR